MRMSSMIPAGVAARDVAGSVPETGTETLDSASEVAAAVAAGNGNGREEAVPMPHASRAAVAQADACVASYQTCPRAAAAATK